MYDSSSFSSETWKHVGYTIQVLWLGGGAILITSVCRHNWRTHGSVANRFFVCARVGVFLFLCACACACVCVRMCMRLFVFVCVCDSFVRGKESADTQVHNEDNLNLKIWSVNGGGNKHSQTQTLNNHWISSQCCTELGDKMTVGIFDFFQHCVFNDFVICEDLFKIFSKRFV